MFGLLSFISILFAGKEIIEKPVPKGTHFDWDAYWKDVENGISITEQIKKRECGEYMTTK